MTFTKHAKKRAKQRFNGVDIRAELKHAETSLKFALNRKRKQLKSKSGITFVVEGNKVITVF